jgi:hypothetical protein
MQRLGQRELSRLELRLRPSRLVLDHLNTGQKPVTVLVTSLCMAKDFYVKVLIRKKFLE